METEEWEKDFSGLDPFMLVKTEKAKRYKEAAEVLKLRMEYKKLPGGHAQLYCEADADLTDHTEHGKLAHVCSSS